MSPSSKRDVEAKRTTYCDKYYAYYKSVPNVQSIKSYPAKYDPKWNVFLDNLPHQGLNQSMRSNICSHKKVLSMKRRLKNSVNTPFNSNQF